MDRQQADSKWPYYVVAACLLLLTLAAPASWRAVAPHAASTPAEAREAASVALPDRPARPAVAASAPPPEFAGPTEALFSSVPYPDPSVTAVSVEAASSVTEVDSGSEQAEAVCRSPESEALLSYGGAVTDSTDKANPGSEDVYAWPTPHSLLTQLDQVAEFPECREWAHMVREAVVALTARNRLSREEFSLALRSLREKLGQVDAVESMLREERVVSALRRAHYATVRRADIWEAAHEAAMPPVIDPAPDRIAAASHVTSVLVKSPNPAGSHEMWIRDALVEIERYETFGTSQTASRLGTIRGQLAATGDPRCARVVERIEAHYRNANLRVVCSGYLLNRLLKQPHDTAGDIDEFVGGVPVRGRHLTSTALRMRLVPDDRQIRLGLEAYGQVAADTEALAGPATLESEGETAYLARKLLVYDGARMNIWPAVAAADARNRLRRIRTDVDGLPIVSSIVQSIVRSKHDSRRGQVRWETEGLVSDQVRLQLDSSADPEVRELERQVVKTLVEPARRLRLDPTPLELSTTEHRITGRFRMAGPNQLGAHTARPRAPSDSVLSLQIHESALNNAVSQLDLDGKTFTLRGVYEMVAASLGNPTLKAPEDLPDGVHVTFAKTDSIRLRLQSGRVEVKLRLARLVADRRTWKDLTVIAYYEPEAQGLDAQFVRKESIRLTGHRLDTRSNLALRGVFSKMFTRTRPLHLVPDRILTDRRLSDLRVHQLVVEDGWVGLSLGRAGGSRVDDSAG